MELHSFPPLRIIAHLDMDAFFASVEERDNPRLAGKPIVVGADPKNGFGRGVVSTANYAAREYGIRSALPISKAWQFSEAARARGLPPAVFVDGHYSKYGEVSARIMEVLRRYTDHVEQASVDEAYFDLSTMGTSITDPYERAREIAFKIKNEIKMKENLTATVGIGPNKLIAKIASDVQKPDGLTVVRAEDAERFLEPMSLRKIPGVGPKAEEKFKRLGMVTVGEARRLSLAELRELMGKWGMDLYEKLRGRSETPLVEEWEAKSIGEQETFERDASDPEFLRARLAAISRDVYERFARSGFRNFRTIAITVRFADFETKTRATTLTGGVGLDGVNSNTVALETIQFHALRLFLPFLDARENPRRKAFRLLGVRIEKLE
jgi:DNA polymerase IV (DinB-like DNA polymerase)